MTQPPTPGTQYKGDGLSGFPLVQITDPVIPGVVTFFPVSEGWASMYLTHTMPVQVFLRVYSPCENPPAENSISKTDLPWLQPFFSPVIKSLRAGLKKIARLW